MSGRSGRQRPQLSQDLLTQQGLVLLHELADQVLQRAQLACIVRRAQISAWGWGYDR